MRNPPAAPRPLGRHRSLWIASVVVLLALFALLVIRHPRFKSWRATQLATQAMIALENGEAEVAHSRAAAAFQLAPKNFTVLRAAARITASQRDPQAIGFYQSLAGSGVATGEDFAALAEVALDLGRFDVFEEGIQQALDRLPPGDPRLERLLGRYAWMNGDFTAAVAAFRQVAEDNPDSASAKLDLAAVLLASPELSARRTAPPIVEEAIRMDSNLSAPGLRLLGNSEGLSRDIRLDAVSRLLAIPDLPFEDKLDVLRMKVAIDPSLRESVAGDIIASTDLRDMDRRTAVARWLVQLGENQRAFELLPLQDAATRIDWFLVWLDAAAGLGKWREVELALERPGAALPESVRELFLGRALAAQGKPGSITHYERAINAAGGDLERLVYLAGYFNALDQVSLAERALKRLAEDPASARTAWGALIGLYRRQHDTPALLRALETMKSRWKNDPVIENDLLYLRLLTQRNLAQTVEAARAAALEHPQNVPFQITHALALLRQEKPAEAAAIFEGSDLQLGQLLPHQRAIFAAILAANGDEGSARDVAALIDRDALLPEEAELLPPKE